MRRQSVRALLFSVLRRPETVQTFDLPSWRDTVSVARATGLLGRLAAVLEPMPLWPDIPELVQHQLRESLTMVEHQQAAVKAEVDNIAWLLREIDTPVVLLKGAAYVLAARKAAKGRLCQDIDILVDPRRLDAVETTLLQRGWDYEEVEEQDELYYRKWLQELPPFRHRFRQVTLDVHHALIPKIHRHVVDTHQVLALKEDIPETTLSTLCPVDMILHSAAHLFEMRDIDNALRDIGDIDLLLREFGERVGFWEEFIARTDQVGLARCSYYALHFSRQWYGTPLPENVFSAMRRWRPNPVSRAAMNQLLGHAVAQTSLHQGDFAQHVARIGLMYWPPPRLSVLTDPLYWTKRFPRLNRER